MIDPLSLCIPLTTSRDSVPSGPPRKLLKPSPDHPDDYVLEIDYSSYSSFLECPRAGENKLVYSREGTRDQTALNFGRLFHSCEELRLEHGLTDIVKAKQREIVARHYVDHPVAIGEYRNAATMLNVLDRYNALYAHDGWPERVHIHEGEKFVERPYKIELCTIPVNDRLPYAESQLSTAYAERHGPDAVGSDNWKVRNLHIILTGRIDAILSDSNVLWVVDHKTSSRGGTEFITAFNLSLQTRGYAWAAHRLGIPVAGLIMNAVVTRPPTKTGTSIEFQRHTYPYSADSLAEYEDNVRALLSDFVACLTRGYFPQASRSFKSPCAGCDFENNCRLPRHQRHNDLMSTLYRDIVWSPIHE